MIVRGVLLLLSVVGSASSLGAVHGGGLAFSPSMLPGATSTNTAQLAMRTRRLRAMGGLSMATGFGKPTEKESDGLNRDQRRAQKKDEKKLAQKQGKVAAMQKAGEVMSNSLDGKDSSPGKSDKPIALENIRKESMRLREESIKASALKNKPGGPKLATGLPLEDEVRSVPIEVLETVEKSLFFGLFAAGGLWITAGLGTAYDAYMIATKQKVPPGVDEFLGKYVEPFLTPGLAVILGFSIILGGLQFYKYEGGRK